MKGHGGFNRRMLALKILYALIAVSAVLAVVFAFLAKRKYDYWNRTAPVSEAPAVTAARPFAYTGEFYYDYTLEYGPEELHDGIMLADYGETLYDYYNDYARVEESGEKDREGFLVLDDMEYAFFLNMYENNGEAEKAEKYRTLREQIPPLLSTYKEVPERTDALFESYLNGENGR